jgi:hypothetical protein
LNCKKNCDPQNMLEQGVLLLANSGAVEKTS